MIYAGILAAGIGTRMHRQDLPKQFLPLGEKPILINTLEQFTLNPKIERIIVVAPKEWKQFTEDLIAKYDTMGKEVFVISGGESKAKSVYLIFEFIKAGWKFHEKDVLITHDAVRPFITQRIINENVNTAAQYGAACTVISTNDTIIVSDDGEWIKEVPIKKKILAEQTPLTFSMGVLDKLFTHTSTQGVSLELETELVRLCVRLGYPVHTVPGDFSNMKIISPYDLEVANALLTEKKR